MSLVHCKKIYCNDGTDPATYAGESLTTLRKLENVTVCEGWVKEAEPFINRNHPTVELECVHCGTRKYFDTIKYLSVLKALNINYKYRLI